MVQKAGSGNLLDYIQVKETAEMLADELLTFGCPVILLKCGHEGMYLRTAGKSSWRSLGKAAPTNLEGWYGKQIWQRPVKVQRILSRGILPLPVFYPHSFTEIMRKLHLGSPPGLLPCVFSLMIRSADFVL